MNIKKSSYLNSKIYLKEKCGSAQKDKKEDIISLDSKA